MSDPDLSGRTLARHQRLTRSSLFRETFKGGHRYVGRLMVFWVRCGPDASLRLGVVVSKRSLRRAVDRARAKRLLREAYRLNRPNLSGNCDVVLVARRPIIRCTRQAVEKELLILADRAGMRSLKND